MREPFAHDAVLAMGAHDDPQAPGAAITVALCGHWEHEPPCPLAAHHTTAQRDGEVVRLRVLFAAEAEDEGEVRRRVDEALRGGQLTTPAGTVSHWRVLTSGPGVVRDDERDHGARLAAS